MIAIGIILGFIGIGYLCQLVFALLVHALPFIVGVNAGMAAYHSGAGELGGFVVGLIAGGLTFAAGRIAISASSSPLIRTAVALLFVLPAAVMGYFAALHLAQLGVPSAAWQQAFAVFGAVMVGATSWARMVLPDPPDDGWEMAWP
jgi:hypothetical protein